MSDTPERIWANMEIARFNEDQSRLPTNVNVEYTRTDIAEKHIAELKQENADLQSDLDHYQELLGDAHTPKAGRPIDRIAALEQENARLNYFYESFKDLYGIVPAQEQTTNE